jgi:hypothetical protein
LLTVGDLSERSKSKMLKSAKKYRFRPGPGASAK